MWCHSLPDLLKFVFCLWPWGAGLLLFFSLFFVLARAFKENFCFLLVSTKSRLRQNKNMLKPLRFVVRRDRGIQIIKPKKIQTQVFPRCLDKSSQRLQGLPRRLPTVSRSHPQAPPGSTKSMAEQPQAPYKNLFDSGSDWPVGPLMQRDFDFGAFEWLKLLW